MVKSWFPDVAVGKVAVGELRQISHGTNPTASTMRPRFVVRRSSKAGSIRIGTCTAASPKARPRCVIGRRDQPRSAAMLFMSTPYQVNSSRRSPAHEITDSGVRTKIAGQNSFSLDNQTNAGGMENSSLRYFSAMRALESFERHAW